MVGGEGGVENWDSLLKLDTLSDSCGNLFAPLFRAVDSWVKPRRHRDGHKNDLMPILIASDEMKLRRLGCILRESYLRKNYNHNI